MKSPIFGALAFVAFLSAPGYAQDFSAEHIGQVLGVKATTTPDGVIRGAWPRKEVPVEVDGLAMRPFMGLGTWAAFQNVNGQVMLMGDTVLFQDEVNPAIDAAFA